MARFHYWAFLNNDEGQPISGADITIYLAGTETFAKIFKSESDLTVYESEAQVSTNAAGYFEFWIADDTDPNGYSGGQKFKLYWFKIGVAEGMIDYVDIIPPGAEPMDVDDSDETLNKLISNYYGKKFNDHVDDKQYAPGVSKPHGIDLCDKTSTDATYNKLVSNKLLKDLYDIVSVGGVMARSVRSVEISASDWQSDGGNYSVTLQHNLSIEYPLIICYNSLDKTVDKNLDYISVDEDNIKVMSSTNTEEYYCIITG